MFKQHTFTNQIKCKFTPMILLTPEAYYDMANLVELYTKEIGWMGEVVRNKMTFLVTKIYLLDQEANHSTTEITPEGFGSFAEEIMEEHPEDGPDILNRVRFWGHSHHTMACNASDQDNKQMEMLCADVDDFFIRCIANKKGEMNMALYLIDLGLVVEDCQWQIHYPNYDHAERKKFWEEKIKKHVKEKSYGTYNSGNAYQSGRNTTTPTTTQSTAGTGTGTNAASDLEKAWDNYLHECVTAGAAK